MLFPYEDILNFFLFKTSNFKDHHRYVNVGGFPVWFWSTSTLLLFLTTNIPFQRFTNVRQ